MEILGFLFGLGCLVLIAWAMAAPAVLGIAILSGLVFGFKRQRQNRPPGQPSLAPQKFKSATHRLILLHPLHQHFHSAK